MKEKFIKYILKNSYEERFGPRMIHEFDVTIYCSKGLSVSDSTINVLLSHLGNTAFSILDESCRYFPFAYNVSEKNNYSEYVCLVIELVSSFQVNVFICYNETDILLWPPDVTGFLLRGLSLHERKIS
jgi:hypothetical protein